MRLLCFEQAYAARTMILQLWKLDKEFDPYKLRLIQDTFLLVKIGFIKHNKKW